MPGRKPTVVLGVSGGIAAYKAAELARRLQDRGIRVRVVMTRAAQQFIQPLTFAALTGEKVITDLFSSESSEATLSSAIEHIAVAQDADLLLVAPATADLLAKFAHGQADDFLTTTHLAFTGPVVVAPAMNSNMWAHPATRANLATLLERGAQVVEPDAGDLACGMIGPGRLAEPDRIAAVVEQTLGRSSSERDLTGRTVLITAGPTREAIDPVRYISNRSSGRMGHALAEEALSRGAAVIVVSGPAAIEPPPDSEIVRVETAAEMHRAVLENLNRADVVVMAAAVADYRPVAAPSRKLKKDAGAPPLELEPTADILAELGRLKGSRVLVGFAAETENLRENAAGKLRAKNCDLLVANLVGAAAEGAGFDSDENQGLLLTAAGETVELPRSSKREMSRRIFDAVAASVRAAAPAR
jgi:phosphopantothenoylcysteine decarboxylase/phosphopantothenate--cysteine ligase